MNVIKWYFYFLISFLVLLVLLFLSTPPEAVAGQLHPDYSTMLKSGSSVASAPLPKWLAYFFGLGVLGFFVLSLLLGARKASPEKNKQILKYWLIGTAVYVIVYTWMIIVYWQYAQGDANSFFLGFPAPTAWMLFGLGMIPLFFTLVYILKFDELVVSPEELKQFQAIVAERRRREKDAKK